jgi:hypothetical protein
MKTLKYLNISCMHANWNNWNNANWKKNCPTATAHVLVTKYGRFLTINQNGFYGLSTNSLNLSSSDWCWNLTTSGITSSSKSSELNSAEYESWRQPHCHRACWSVFKLNTVGFDHPPGHDRRVNRWDAQLARIQTGRSSIHHSASGLYQWIVVDLTSSLLIVCSDAGIVIVGFTADADRYCWY